MPLRVSQKSQAYHDLDEETVGPHFDLATLSARIIYPPLAKRQGKEGTVVLRLFISSGGMVDDVVVVEDPGFGFGEAAVRAFEGMSARPAARNGTPIAVSIVFPIQFSLK